MLTCTTFMGPIPEIHCLGLMRISNTSEPMDLEAHEDHYELLFLHTGEKNMYVDGRCYSMRSGDVLLIPPGIVHGNSCDLQSRSNLTYLIFSDPADCDSYLGLSPQDKTYLTSCLEKMRMSQMMPSTRHILQQFTEQMQKEGGVLHAPLVSALFLLLLDSVTQSLPQSSERFPADIQRVLDYIEDTRADLPDTAQLAAIADLSEAHFKQKFKQHVGLPPAEYTARRHVEWAEKRLADASVPITQIARECGFSSSQHLTRIFKRYHGVTPSEYRKKDENDII